MTCEMEAVRPRSICHQAGAASVCVHEPPPQLPSVLPSMARLGSPPQPTVLERVVPQTRIPLVPEQPPPQTWFVVTAQEFGWPAAMPWHGSKAHSAASSNRPSALMRLTSEPNWPHGHFSSVMASRIGLRSEKLASPDRLC